MLVRYVKIGVLFVLGVVGASLAVLYEKVTRRRGINRTAEEVADVIAGFIAGRVSAAAWDDFVCVPISDETLEPIRLRCLDLPDEFPASDAYCNEEGVEVLRGLVERLRGGRCA